MNLDGVFWLGGSPCSGKSSVGRQLGSAGFTLYAVDEREDEHLARARPETEPEMSAWRIRDADANWLRPVAEQLEAEMAFYRERFTMILADIAALPRPLLVEGAALLPDLLHGLGVSPGHAFFMVPTWTFQMEHYSRRPWVEGVLQGCSAPERAFANWMRRDQRFGNAVARRAVELGWPVMRVDGGVGLPLTVLGVRDCFALGKA